MNKKKTSDAVASVASKVLQDDNASKIQKELAGSALAQHRTGKRTGPEMEEKAAKVLQSEKYSEKTKSLAGSVLGQSDKER